MSATWLAGDAMAFDTETTGIDPCVARIVTASCITVGRSGIKRRRNWLVNPGVEIPAGATAIHGVTNEKARTEGESPLTAIPAIATELLSAWAMGWPVIIMNSPYDLTLLGEEIERVAHEMPEIGPVLDPLAIDRCCEPLRKGKRTLTALCQRYGVRQQGAHSSEGDALTAARVVWMQAKANPDLNHMTLAEMNVWQAWGHAAWAAELELWMRQQGKPEVVDRSWPVRRAA